MEKGRRGCSLDSADLSEEGADDFGSFNAREPPVKTLVFHREAFVINSEIVKNRSVEITNMHRVFYNIIAMIIGLSVIDAGLEPAAGHPGCEATAVVIPPVVCFR